MNECFWFMFMLLKLEKTSRVQHIYIYIYISSAIVPRQCKLPKINRHLRHQRLFCILRCSRANDQQATPFTLSPPLSSRHHDKQREKKFKIKKKFSLFSLLSSLFALLLFVYVYVHSSIVILSILQTLTPSLTTRRKFYQYKY